MCAAAAIFLDRPPPVFHPVGGIHLEWMQHVTRIFNEVLTPLYGSQDKALEQIRRSTDRRCLLLCEGETPVGILVFKLVLSDEFASYGVQRSVEIKTLFVVDSEHNSGKGIGSTICRRLEEEVAHLRLSRQWTHVTVSERKEESLAFFRKKGFQIMHQWLGRYVAGVNEYLLARREEVPPLLEPRMGSLSLSAAETALVAVVVNAHWGRVHTLTRFPDGTFVSGSEDNCLRQWDLEGKCQKDIYEVDPTHQDERDWITAAAASGDHFISGKRNGGISQWTVQGEYKGEVRVPPPSGGYMSHPHNTRRVVCLAPGLALGEFFVGFPTQFARFNITDGSVEPSPPVHLNDWVYCLHALPDSRVLAAIGGQLDVWGKTDTAWEQNAILLREGRRVPIVRDGKKTKQRVFISSIAPVPTISKQVALSLFDGSIKVVDMPTARVVADWQGHTNKAWRIECVGSLLVSSGEDRTIRFWDLRVSQGAVGSIGNHVGEVTALLALKPNLLVAGTAPENPLRAPSGAELRIYDVKNISLQRPL